MTDHFSNDAPVSRHHAPRRWYLLQWWQPVAWLVLHRAAANAERAFTAAKARGRRHQGARAAYRALTGLPYPDESGDHGDTPRVQFIAASNGRMGLMRSRREEEIGRTLDALPSRRGVAARPPADGRVLALYLALYLVVLALGYVVPTEAGHYGLSEQDLQTSTWESGSLRYER